MWLLLAVQLLSLGCEVCGKHNVSKMLDYLISDTPDQYGSIRYDKTLRPNFGGSRVNVGITMNIDSLGPIDEVNMNFRTDVSFRQFWRDSRLKFDVYPNNTYNTSLTLSHAFLDRIWVPDTYFPDSLYASKQDVMVPNVLLRLDPTGDILYSSRVTVVAKCPMHLHYFPMDYQTCRFYVECYGYTGDDLYLYWYTGDDSVAMSESVRKLAQFSVEKITLINDTLQFSTGSFSQLIVSFHFKRDLLYFILQSYVPSTFIVMCSWVAFWINRSGIPGRACLSITTVLSLITLIGSTNAKLPNVSAVKALDVYFGMCFVYVFGGLLEFATVIYLESSERKEKEAQREKDEQAKKYMEKMKNKTENYLLEEIGQTFSTDIPRRTSVKGEPIDQQARHILLEYRSLQMSEAKLQRPKPRKWTASRIEVYSRICFPSSFCVFQVLYWTYYNVHESQES